MKVCLGEEADLLDGYNLFCLLAWIGTHDKHTFTLPKERIHVENADALGREQSDSLSCLTWRIVDAQGKDIGQLHVDAVLAKEQIGLSRLIAESLVSAMVEAMIWMLALLKRSRTRMSVPLLFSMNMESCLMVMGQQFLIVNY